MKRIRGFGYVGDVDDDEEDEFELDDVELEPGFASERVSKYRAVRAYSCPRCKREILEADVVLHEVIFIRCPKCKRKVAIETKPIIQPIGFINQLSKGEKKNDCRSKAR